MPSFAQLGLSEPLRRAIDPAGLRAPTEVQVRAIPLLLQERDLLALAPAGAGKTLAWGLALLQRLSEPVIHAEPRAPRALVLMRDRETADNAGLELEAVGRFMPVRHLVAAEGAGWNHQMQELRTGVELLVSTPKRLLELHRQKAVVLRAVEILVVDDADVLVDLDLVLELERIRVELPMHRQTAMFAATTPSALRKFAEEWMQKPVGIKARGGAKKTMPSGDFAIPKIDEDVDAEPPVIELPDWLDEAPVVHLPGWLDDDTAVFDPPKHDEPTSAHAVEDDAGEDAGADDSEPVDESPAPADAAMDDDDATTDAVDGDDDLDAIVADALDELDRRAREGTSTSPPTPPAPPTPRLTPRSDAKKPAARSAPKAARKPAKKAAAKSVGGGTGRKKVAKKATAKKAPARKKRS